MNDIKFPVPGVPEEHTWQLLNIWWYSYYLKKVRALQAGICEFCQLDRIVNKIIFEDEYFRLWENTVSPLPGQHYQFVIASVRHFVHFDDINDLEMLALRGVLKRIRTDFELLGYAGVIRSGDSGTNAKTVDHFHFNVHVADGTKDVRPFIGKDRQTVLNNIPVLALFERMRLLEELRVSDPFSYLDLAERELVKDRLAPTQKK